MVMRFCPKMAQLKLGSTWFYPVLPRTSASSGGSARLDAQLASYRCLGYFEADEARGESEEGNHEFGSSEPTRRDHSGVSLDEKLGISWLRRW